MLKLRTSHAPPHLPHFAEADLEHLRATDNYSRLPDCRSGFVVDTRFIPTGLGLNPMVTVVANALRVGTWIVDQCRRGEPELKKG
jgi:hypothetical protein